MSTLDAKIRKASARLNEVRKVGDDVLTEFYFDELNSLLDEWLDQRSDQRGLVR